MKIQRIPIILPETGNWKYPTKTIKICPRCGEHFVPRSPRAIYCDNCKYAHELEQARQRGHKYTEREGALVVVK